MPVVQGGGVTFDAGAGIRDTGNSILNASAQIVKTLQARKQLAMLDAEQRRTTFFDNAAKFSSDPNAWLRTPAGQAEYEGYLRAQNEVANADRLFGSLFQQGAGMTPAETVTSMRKMENTSPAGLASISAADQMRQNILNAAGQAEGVSTGIPVSTPQQVASPMMMRPTMGVTPVAGMQQQAQAPVQSPVQAQDQAILNQVKALKDEAIAQNNAQNYAKLLGASRALGENPLAGAVSPAIESMYAPAGTSRTPVKSTPATPSTTSATPAVSTQETPITADSKTLRAYYNEYLKANPNATGKTVATEYAGGVDDATIWKSLPEQAQKEFITKTGAVPTFEALPTSKFAQKSVETKVAKLSADAGKANEILSAAQSGAATTDSQKMLFKAALTQTNNDYAKALELVPQNVRKAINDAAINQVMGSSSLGLQLMGATTLADRKALLEQLDTNINLASMDMMAKSMGESGVPFKDLLDSVNKEDEILSKQEAEMMAAGKFKTLGEFWKAYPNMRDRRNNVTTLRSTISKNINPEMSDEQRFKRYKEIAAGFLHLGTKIVEENPLENNTARMQAAQDNASKNVYDIFRGTSAK